MLKSGRPLGKQIPRFDLLINYSESQTRGWRKTDIHGGKSGDDDDDDEDADVDDDDDDYDDDDDDDDDDNNDDYDFLIIKEKKGYKPTLILSEGKFVGWKINS